MLDTRILGARHANQPRVGRTNGKRPIHGKNGDKLSRQERIEYLNYDATKGELRPCTRLLATGATNFDRIVGTPVIEDVRSTAKLLKAQRRQLEAINRELPLDKQVSIMYPERVAKKLAGALVCNLTAQNKVA